MSLHACLASTVSMSYLSNPFNLLSLILTTQSQRTRYLSHKMKSKPFYAVLLEQTLFIYNTTSQAVSQGGKAEACHKHTA